MLVAISGNIGAGKTTLVSRLADHLGWHAEFEAVDHNPYLEAFYQDMPRWAFQLQVYFLSHRFRQGRSLITRKQSVVLDRTIYEDAHVFARNLYDSSILTETDFRTYLNLYETMADLVAVPNLLIYLHASVRKLDERIHGRVARGDRAFEGDIPQTYLQDLNHRYEDWISQYNYSPVIRIDIDQTDLAEEVNFRTLVKNIRSHA